MSYTKGYKAFNRIAGSDKSGECRGFIFEEGGIYEQPGELVIRDNGFHFCKNLVLTFDSYGSCPDTYIFAEVEAVGEVVYDEPTKHIAATSKIKIIRFLSNSEFLKIIDSGDNSSGNSNSGNWNSGDWNSGDWNSGSSNSGDSNSGNSNSGNSNSGDSNSGHRNSGSSNSGHRNSGSSNSGKWNSGSSNSGDSNSGDSNSGHRNSGSSNSGNWNSGSWNSCDNESGFFNTESTIVNAFNKPCLRKDWAAAKKPLFLFFDLLPEGYPASWQKSFEAANREQCELLVALPNFDYEVFEKITSITRAQIEAKLNDHL